MTTLAMLLHSGSHAIVAHIGDSPIFLVRDGHIGKLTREHTRVHELEAAGIITPQEARYHPQRHTITQALGWRAQSIADYQIIPTQPGDIFALVSDGVSGFVSQEELVAIMHTEVDADPSPAGLARCAEAIINQALNAQTTDNASVVLGLVVAPAPGVTSVYDAPTATGLPANMHIPPNKEKEILYHESVG